MTKPTTVYRLYDPAGGLLYVGVTGDPARRFEEHTAGKTWWEDVASINLEHFDDRGAALRAERRAIRSERPLHNIAHNRAAASTSPERRSWDVADYPDCCPRCDDDDAHSLPYKVWTDGTAFYQCHHCNCRWKLEVAPPAKTFMCVENRHPELVAS